MRYLHTMLRVRNLDQALDFYCNKLGLKEARRRVDEKNRYTLVFLAAPEDEGRVEDSRRSGRDAPLVELTWNWDSEDYGEARYFGVVTRNELISDVAWSYETPPDAASRIAGYIAFDARRVAVEEVGSVG